ncbi:GPO family capsid scaffolding protein [Aeromonas hydrophila]|uniref:GPO family capsid scaffolding protein n=1 Tax=Aeromonas TaxID=642 RepID=UPI00191F3FFC|nr:MULTISPECIES: GPO family capsid scaffolding protein [Aeromonas]MBL0660550.1 GPO family capsid scaffolding protein [Aeromonas dhakensis]MCX4106245.1 GPO family capsid scaffolding protein [Aeromonas hydrophila]
MAKKAKFKRVAVAGQTTDGRTIAPEWLTQAAKNYNQEKYGARVNLEHFRSLYPDSAFRAYGDVRSVYAEEVEIDGEKKMALFAEIDPTDDLIKLTKARQKVYTSIELDLDFAGTGEAYLVGLAVTDSPASLGTEYLQFCAGAGEKSPLASRKQKPANLFSSAIETEIELSDEGDKGPSLAERITALFSSHKKQSSADFSDVHQAVETVAKEVTSLDAGMQKQFAEQAKTITELTSKLDATAKELADLTANLEGQEELSHKRLPATGSDGATIQTDC